MEEGRTDMHRRKVHRICARLRHLRFVSLPRPSVPCCLLVASLPAFIRSSPFALRSSASGFVSSLSFVPPCLVAFCLLALLPCCLFFIRSSPFALRSSLLPPPPGANMWHQCAKTPSHDELAHSATTRLTLENKRVFVIQECH